jgi:hypothetical protein
MEALETTGPLTELGRIAADWFDEIVPPRHHGAR